MKPARIGFVYAQQPIPLGDEKSGRVEVADSKTVIDCVFHIHSDYRNEKSSRSTTTKSDNGSRALELGIPFRMPLEAQTIQLMKLLYHFLKTLGNTTACV